MVKQMRPPFEVVSHFSEGLADEMPDDEWLAIVGRKRWVAVSYDGKWHKEEAPLLAIKQFKVACFYVWGAQMPVWDKIGLLHRVYPKMKTILNSERRPFIYKFSDTGRCGLVRHWDGRKEPQKYVRAERAIQTGGA